MGILSLVIWTPIVLGVLIFALGRDDHAGLVRWAALFSALLSFSVRSFVYRLRQQQRLDAVC